MKTVQSPARLHKRTGTMSRTKLVRMVIIGLLMAVMFSFGALVQAYAGSGEAANAAPNKLSVNEMASVEVEKGDTLWEIASTHTPKNESTRHYLERLMKANGLTKVDLQVGQVLLLP